MNITIQDLLDKYIAFMGTNWVKDESVKDGPVPGHREEGEIPFINCNDFFAWGCADGEDINEETLPELQKAVEDCKGDMETGALLYCARRRKIRPQGACYSMIPEELWPLFHDCGPERETGFGNPYKPGEYKRNAKS